MSTIFLAALLLSGPTQAYAPAYERTIHRASEFAPWCKDEAEARYIAKGLTPFQWTASYHDRNGVLHVKGSLRVDGETIEVRCSIAQGARERYATIEIDDPRL
jgi:hypothetical protein